MVDLVEEQLRRQLKTPLSRQLREASKQEQLFQQWKAGAH